MNDVPRALLVVTIATAITITGCSSSNNTLGMLDDPQSEALNTPDSGPLPLTAPSSFPLDTQGFDLIERLGGYHLEGLSEEVALIGELAASSAISSEPL